MRRALVCAVALMSVSALDVSAQPMAALSTTSALGPPPGRLVDVGGYRLHIACVGTGAPTIVIDAGAGSWSLQWTAVQRSAAATGATVCTYDRAGLGWSDVSPRPRRTAQMADELHALVHNAGLAPPLVLAGHSLGAWNVRAYQARYPEEVVGLVLLDGAHEQQWTRLPAIAWELTKMSAAATRARADTVRRGGMAPADVADVLFLNFVPERRADYVASMRDPRTYDTIAAETASADVSASDVPRSAPGALGDLPLVVVTAMDSFGAFAGTPIPQAEANAVWQQLQTELVQLSRSSEQIRSERGHHRLYESDPQAAVQGLQRMVALVRARAAVPAALGIDRAKLPTTSTPDVDRLLKNLETSYRAKDVDAFVGLFTDDFTQLDVNRRVHVRGRETWTEWTHRINTAHTTMDRVHRGRAVIGPWVVVEIEWSGELRPGAVGPAERSYRYTGLGLLRLAGGRIQEQVLYGDFATFSEQIAGHAPGR